MEGTPFGRYRLVELLGRGGMGEVWRAFDTQTNRVVAVKVLPASLASDPVFEQRFRREAFAAAQLNEPHVVPIHSFGEIDGRLYVDMRLVEGRDLESLLTEGPLEPSRAAMIIDQIGSALHAAHKSGLVHRDVKPSNILVGEDDFAYLIDFGIARGTDQTSLTSSNSVIGTWAYMAPERLTSARTDERADIYALACVLHECLTGEQPYPSNSLEQQIAGHLAMPPPRPSALRNGVPTQFDDVIATGMAKDPDKRYATTRELAKAARAAVTGPLPRATAPAAPTAPVSFADRTVADRTAPTRGIDHHVPQGFAAPTAHGAPTRFDPRYVAPSAPDVAPAPRKSRRVPIAIAAVVGVLIVGIGTSILVRGDDSVEPGPTPDAAPDTPQPEAGPLTGTFTAKFDPLTSILGASVDDSTDEETWSLRSVCAEDKCVATAKTASSSVMDVSSLVFDDIGGRWIAVDEIPGSCQDDSVDTWVVVTLVEKPDGAFSGDYTTYSPEGCSGKRTLTMTRTGEVSDAMNVPDPAGLPARTASPAEAFRGRYDTDITFPDNPDQTPYEYDMDVTTYCLRDGQRCMSFLYSSVTVYPLVFAGGKWTLVDNYDAPCSLGGDTHVFWTGDFPLPQPAQDPITELTGSGKREKTGLCTNDSFEAKFSRIGDV